MCHFVHLCALQPVDDETVSEAWFDVVILSYTGFLTSSIFFRLFAEDVSLSDDAGRQGIARIQDTGLMIGYYFEGIDSLFRDRL